MKSLFINENSLKKYKKIKSDFNNESNIYIKDELLYKILLDEHRNLERLNNIKLLSSYSHPNCIFPKDIVYNKVNKYFIGLTIEYLKNYKTLSKSLEDNNLTFDKRKELAYKICKVQSFLEKENISFLDMHSNNIMVKDDDIKVIDLDSAVIHNNDYSDVFEHIRKDIISSNLAQVCFQLLYGKDVKFTNEDNKIIMELLSISNRRQRVFLEKALLHKSHLIHPIDYLDEFNENYMEESKLVLHK